MLPENTAPTAPSFFETILEVRITDLNYGNHVGNDAFLRFAHEARVRWLASLGFSEKDIGGPGLILTEVQISFRAQSFYGDILKISVNHENVSRSSFDLIYQVMRTSDMKEIASIRTKMVCFDYTRQKVVSVPEPFKKNLSLEKNAL